MGLGPRLLVGLDDPRHPVGIGGYINQNFTQTFAALGLSAQQAWQLARNSFDASFIDEARRRNYLDRLNQTFETFQ